MHDQTPGRSSQNDNEAFADALDDLFGPEDPDNERKSPVEPAADVAEIESTATFQSPHTPPEGSMHSTQAASSSMPEQEPAQGRSMVRWVGLGCVGVFALIFICLVILAVIGIAFGDPATATQQT